MNGFRVAVTDFGHAIRAPGGETSEKGCGTDYTMGPGMSSHVMFD